MREREIIGIFVFMYWDIGYNGYVSLRLIFVLIFDSVFQIVVSFTANHLFYLLRYWTKADPIPPFAPIFPNSQSHSISPLNSQNYQVLLPIFPKLEFFQTESPIPKIAYWGVSVPVLGNNWQGTSEGVRGWDWEGWGRNWGFEIYIMDFE